MGRIRKSVWLPVLLAVYLTVYYIYLFMEGKIPLDLKSLGIIALSYILVAVLWYINNRKKPKSEA